MPTPLEAEIGSLLKNHGDPSLAASELLSRIHRNLLSEVERIDSYQFLIAAGLLTEFFAEMSRLVDLSAKIPWAQFAEALGLGGLKLDEFDIQAIFDACESQGAVDHLVRSRRLDSVHRGFAERRHFVGAAKVKETNEKKQALKDKLAYMRANRMFEQEGQVLDELQALFPDEADIKVEREALEIRRARDIVANASSQTDPTADLLWKVERLTPEQKTAKNMIVARAKELAEDDVRLAYDLAVSLHMMDFNQEALEVLQYAESGRAAEWLRLELMIRGRQFVTALDEASRLEIAYADDPDAAFAVTYARARALHGLGQPAQAIELLRSLIRIRPHYKSAQSLLMDWAGSEA